MSSNACLSIDFEDTYDGLADQLDEADDAFNDDTFGGGGEQATQASVGKDFDFFGQTAQVSDVISEEQLRYNLQRPGGSATPQSTAPAAPKAPKRTGYEKYQDPGYIPDIQAKSSVWGSKPAAKLAQQPETASAPAKKMMSLEEVEAQMRAQSQRPAPPSQPPGFAQSPVTAPQKPGISQHAPQHQQMPPPPEMFPQPVPPEFYRFDQHQQQGQIPRNPPISQLLQQPHPQHEPMPPHPPGPPFQILQNASRPQNVPPQRAVPQPHRPQVPHPQQPPQPSIGPNGTTPIITHPQQMMHLSEEQRVACLMEDAKRAKRNHKIHLLSKGNGLMTPQDKNFITRIQLQQLVAATGNVSDLDPEALLSEDFYYQVYSQIRGVPRQHPRQPLGHFAQTYLFQTGGRSGTAPGRRHFYNGDNHIQRMQQQVQRAVEAAKLKPKNKQLIIEGSLGKISFSNAKTPKPLLNIKRPESSDGHKPAKKGQHSHLSSSDRKSILNNIESVYSTLMKLEDHERSMPPAPEEGETDAEVIETHMEWRQKFQALNQKLWDDMNVMEPIVPDSTTPHPFIAFLSYSKGKKAIPRIFRHIDQEQRVTILTMVVVHLDTLDVIQRAQLRQGEAQPPLAVREEIDLFSQAVMPSLLGYVNEAPMNIIIGLLGLVMRSTNLPGVAKTKVGLGILTMLLSRAELVKEAGNVSESDWQNWTSLYNRLFDALEPSFSDIFPGSINSGDDMYIWQFLAAVGIGASPEQQQRLVIAVK